MSANAGQIEEQLQMVYHALLIVNSDLTETQRAAVMEARLIGMKHALRTACELATEDGDEEWTMLRGRVMSAARYHYSRDAVTPRLAKGREHGVSIANETGL